MRLQVKLSTAGVFSRSLLRAPPNHTAKELIRAYPKGFNVCARKMRRSFLAVPRVEAGLVFALIKSAFSDASAFVRNLPSDI
jgi:hypothetical protein